MSANLSPPSKTQIPSHTKSNSMSNPVFLGNLIPQNVQQTTSINNNSNNLYNPNQNNLPN